MKNLFNKFGLKVMGAIAIFGAFLGSTGLANAQTPDPDLVASLASTTAIITNNKGTILSFIVGALFAVFVIALSIKALRWVFGMILGLLGKGKRR